LFRLLQGFFIGRFYMSVQDNRVNTGASGPKYAERRGMKETGSDSQNWTPDDGERRDADKENKVPGYLDRRDLSK